MSGLRCPCLIPLAQKSLYGPSSRRIPQLAGSAPGRDVVDPDETGGIRHPDERADGVLAVAQPLQGPVDVARRPHAQALHLLGFPVQGVPVRPREDVPPRGRSQLRPVGRYQRRELRHRRAPQAHR
jgi:hypothetical protein